MAPDVFVLFCFAFFPWILLNFCIKSCSISANLVAPVLDSWLRVLHHIVLSACHSQGKIQWPPPVVIMSRRRYDGKVGAVKFLTHDSDRVLSSMGNPQSHYPLAGHWVAYLHNRSAWAGSTHDFLCTCMLACNKWVTFRDHCDYLWS